MGDDNKRLDEQTGTYTTGHEWDGIEELENEPPKWWKMVFVACVLFALLYILLFPSVPTHEGFFPGILGWTEEKRLQGQMERLEKIRAPYANKLKASSPGEILQDPSLRKIAYAGGRSVFNERCAGCHGRGGGGLQGGYPVLADDDWLWGGSVEQIYQTIRYGVRIDENGRQSRMPMFGQMLSADDTHALAVFVRGLSGAGEAPVGKEAEHARQLFADNCASCHSADGPYMGGRAFGAPRLNDAVWLYSSDLRAIESQIRTPKHGAMPAWEKVLTPEELKMLSVYVWSLGGGEASTVADTSPRQTP